MIAKNKNRIIAGFTLLELVAIIILTGILCSFGIVKHVDFVKEAKKSTEDSIVGAIRSGITLYYVKNNSYPQELDMAANGMASNANPFFSNVLSSPVTKEWKKPVSATSVLWKTIIFMIPPPVNLMLDLQEISRNILCGRPKPFIRAGIL